MLETHREEEQEQIVYTTILLSIETRVLGLAILLMQFPLQQSRVRDLSKLSRIFNTVYVRDTLRRAVAQASKIPRVFC